MRRSATQTPTAMAAAVNGLGTGEAEDGSEQDIDASRGVRGAVRGGVQGEEEGADTQDRGEHAADDRVVSATPAPEQSHEQGEDDAGSEEPDSKVEAEHEGGQRARERHVGQRITGEDLSAQHHVVADESAAPAR